MLWETRRTRRYCYTKRRRGGCVISDYVGAGEAAEAIATLETLYREERTPERQQWRREQESRLSLDAGIDHLGAAIRLLVAAALLAGDLRLPSGDNLPHPPIGQNLSRDV